MTSRLLKAVMAAAIVFGSIAPAMDAQAQHNRSGRTSGPSFRSAGPSVRSVGPSFRSGGPSFRGGPGYRGYGYNGYNNNGALIAGLALGAALGYYAGHPYYCRHHHHWRWSRYYQRYVYVYDGYC